MSSRPVTSVKVIKLRRGPIVGDYNGDVLQDILHKTVEHKTMVQSIVHQSPTPLIPMIPGR